MSLIYDDVKAGREPDMDKFDRVMWEFARSGCDRVILACTELSVLQKYREMPEITLDAMDVLVRESIILQRRPLPPLVLPPAKKGQIYFGRFYLGKQ